VYSILVYTVNYSLLVENVILKMRSTLMHFYGTGCKSFVESEKFTSLQNIIHGGQPDENIIEIAVSAFYPKNYQLVLFKPLD